jgi:molybdopterin converting factor small subunit
MNHIVVKYFGRLTDITSTSEEFIEIENGVSISNAEDSVLKKHSSIKEEVYTLFHNRTMVADKNKLLNKNDELCFMPPFTGG